MLRQSIERSNERPRKILWSIQRRLLTNIELKEWDGEEFICTVDSWNPDFEEEEED